jgi:hypothetical protein
MGYGDTAPPSDVEENRDMHGGGEGAESLEESVYACVASRRQVLSRSLEMREYKSQRLSIT